MRLGQFMWKSFLHSFPVALRMVPVLIVAVFTAFVLVDQLIEYPVGLIFVAGSIYVPSLMFLYLSAVRAGLVSMGATRAPNLNKMVKTTWKVIRFQFMLNNLVLGIFGVGGTFLLLYLHAPDVVELWQEGVTVSLLTDFQKLTNIINQIPVALGLVWIFAISVSAGLIGTSVAAMGAACAENGPNHDMLWGVTRKFMPIFLTTFLFTGLPYFLAMPFVGGPLAPLYTLLQLPDWALVAWPLYMMWTASLTASAQAYGYVETLRDNKTQKSADEAAMLGRVYEDDELREIRLARQARGSLQAE